MCRKIKKRSACLEACRSSLKIQSSKVFSFGPRKRTTTAAQYSHGTSSRVKTLGRTIGHRASETAAPTRQRTRDIHAQMYDCVEGLVMRLSCTERKYYNGTAWCGVLACSEHFERDARYLWEGQRPRSSACSRPRGSGRLSATARWSPLRRRDNVAVLWLRLPVPWRFLCSWCALFLVFRFRHTSDTSSRGNTVRSALECTMVVCGFFVGWWFSVTTLEK